MATIVEHKETKQRAILLGAGFGIYKAMYPGVVFGSADPRSEQKQYETLCLSDKHGNIFFEYAHQLVVVEIDGKSIQDFTAVDTEIYVQPKREYYCHNCCSMVIVEKEKCPKCDYVVRIPDEHRNTLR